MTITEKPLEGTSNTNQLAEFATKLTYGDIPEQVITAAKLFTLECVGHMLSGSRQQVSQIVLDYVGGIGAKGEATVVGAKFKSSVAEAAYANGTLAHADELEAYGTLAGTGLVPPIVAGLVVAEWLNKSGREYLEAVVAGIEIQGRLGTAGLGAPDRGFMGFSLVGPGGSCVTAGKLLGIGAFGIQNALGVALPLGGGSLRGCGYMTHVHEAGVPSRIGVWAAVLVSRGFTGCPDYLDGAFSWGEQFASGGRGYHPDELTANLGNGEFFLQSSGAAPKLYGSCGLTHLAIEGLIDLMTENNLSGSDIASVELIVPAFADRVASFKEPTNGEEAKFSIRHAAAGILVDGVPDLPYIKPFTDAGAEDSRYIEARRRVRLVLNEAAGNTRGFASQTVNLTLVDGRQLSKVVEGNSVRGRESAPLTADERINMFFHTVDGVTDLQNAQRIVDLVMECENRPVAELAQAISGF